MFNKTNPRLLLSGAFIILGLIIAAVPENTTKPYKLTADQLLDEVKTRTQFVHPDLIADMLVNKDPVLQLIDVRSKDEYEKFSLPGAINIPINDLLNPKWIDIFDQDIFMNVFYSNGTTSSNEAWLLTRQLGYQNIYVLEGGLNYWIETIINPEKPGLTSPNDEFARYDFRKATSAFFGGNVNISANSDTTSSANKPVMIPKRKKKKAVKGGCS
ncbi:MAG: rhodanese-like domain-containing protein [Bacteroidales bacterium]|nr:rhodanese-like domain-containing protein [Bacteroidales bacterium]